MKHYIIFTHIISGLGGGQLYTLRRARYLLNKGYKVTIIDHHDENNFVLKNQFQGCDIFHETQFNYPISYFSPNKSESIIDNLICRLNLKESNIYIETHGIRLGVWGEKLAIKLQGRHLIYCYEEWHLVKNYKLKPGKDFFIRKYLKNEFYGCTSESIKILFGDIFNFNNYLNIPFDKSEIKESSRPELAINQDKKYFTITTVSRLEKSYIESLLNDIGVFATKHPNQKIRLIIGGGAKTEQRLTQLQRLSNKICLNHKNLDIIFTGFIYELGKDLYNITDVFVGMGTASINAISQGVITINIDPLNNNLSSGFFGIDTMSAAFSDTNIYYSIFEKIEEAYEFDDERRDEYKKISENLFVTEFSIESIGKKLDYVIDSIEPARPHEDLNYAYCYHVLISTIINIRKIGGKILRKFGLK